MIETETLSTPEGCTNNIPMTPNPYLSTKNNSARKSLRQFTEKLDVKHKTTVQRFGEAKENCKATKKAMCCVNTLKSAVVIQK